MMRVLALFGLGRLTPQVWQRCEVRLDLRAKVLEIGRQRQLLAEVLLRFVGGESGALGGDLEEDPTRLAEGARAEVEAIDHRRPAPPPPDDTGAPPPLVAPLPRPPHPTP